MASYTLPPNVEYVPSTAPSGLQIRAVSATSKAKGPWLTPKRKAILFLMFMSAAIAELVSGSSPPAEFFNPFSFTLLVLFYGCGAVLVRETAVRWNKGFAGILLLGVAFGILEEGMSVKSWLDPGWMDLGTLAWYGRFWGINWVWAVWLTIYHAVCSITIPIIITDMMFPQFKGQRITDDEGWKSYKGFFLLGSSVWLFCFLFLTPYRPPVPQFILVSSFMVLAIWLAYKVPNPLIRATPGRPSWSPARFFLLGSFLMFFSFIGSGSAISPVPFMEVLVVCVVDLVIMLALIGHIGTISNSRHLVAFIAGCESPFLFIGIMFDIFSVGYLGMSIVSIVTAVGFVLLYKKMEKVDLASEDAKKVPAKDVGVKTVLTAMKF